VEAWIKPTAFGILNQIVHKGGTGAPGVDRDGFHLRLDAGNMINFDIANGSSIEVVGTPVTTADLNQWMAIEYDLPPNTKEVYFLDGGNLGWRKQTAQLFEAVKSQYEK
jgi:hypothetical protein